MLEEEIKWLAVTHKSFDHGRRGFNDRLAFLGESTDVTIRRIEELQLTAYIIAGKRMVDLQASLAMLDSAPPTTSMSESENGTAVTEADEYGREPYRHRALQGLQNLSDARKQQTLAKESLAQLAHKYRLNTVMRWKPRQVCSPNMDWACRTLTRYELR